MTTASAESLLILTGSMGAGKTAVLAEASDLLVQRHVVHAAIDLDALGIAELAASAPSDKVTYQNLRCVCRNYALAGVTRFLLAVALETRAHLDQCREIIPAANTLVCRLTASIDVMERRVALREQGIFREGYMARVSRLNAILDDARLEDFSINNENRPVCDVAFEVLARAQWLSP